jgi:hypothetical protein
MGAHMKAHKQLGASLIGVATIILIVGGIAFIATKVTPVYFEFFRVYSAMEKLAAQPETGGLAPSKVKTALMKRLYIDDVDGVKREHIIIKRESNVMYVTVKYEKRSQALDTLDLVGKYENTIELKIPEL